MLAKRSSPFRISPMPKSKSSKKKKSSHSAVEQARSAESRAEGEKIKNMNTQQSDPKTMATDLLLLSKEAVAAKCSELNIKPIDSKTKMIDKIIVKTFGIDECKKAFARR